jgi:hypothetical protein
LRENGFDEVVCRSLTAGIAVLLLATSESRLAAKQAIGDIRFAAKGFDRLAG